MEPGRGVDGLTAEVELLAAAVGHAKPRPRRGGRRREALHARRALGAADVARRAAGEVRIDVRPHGQAGQAAAEDEVRTALLEAGLDADAAQKLLSTLALTDFDELEAAMGKDSPAVAELRELFELADAYGLREWLVLDLSVVRGLAYYTGVVFEGFDRKGELRAIFGGGRYDKLLGTFGGEDLPAAGFGFGDAVIFELLQAKGLLPDLAAQRTDTVLVACQDESLRPRAMAAAARSAARAWRSTWCSSPRSRSGSSSTPTASPWATCASSPRARLRRVWFASSGWATASSSTCPSTASPTGSPRRPPRMPTRAGACVAAVQGGHAGSRQLNLRPMWLRALRSLAGQDLPM